MVVDPKSLLVNLNSLTDKESEDMVRSIYEKEYLNKETHQGRIGVLKTHDDEDVIFKENQFRHAFYKSKNRTLFPDDKSVFDRDRAARIRWIHGVIKAEFETVECWDCPGYGVNGPRRRLYVSWAEEYVVWLITRGAGGFRFETAYCAPARYIREKYVRGSRRIKLPRD